MTHEWLHALRQCGDRGVDAVLVTVREGKGSTPRDAGAKMVVTVDALHGTIGGGELEFQALEVARTMLRETAGRREHRFALGASLGQVCGGAANLLFERVPAGAEWVRVLSGWHHDARGAVIATPTDARAEGRLLVAADGAWGSLGDPALDAAAAAAARSALEARTPGATVASLPGASVALECILPTDFEIVLFGAGHVGRALARIFATLPCRVRWIDARANEFPPAAAPNIEVVVTDDARGAVDAAPAGAVFLVLTHSHALDFELVEAILRRRDFSYCGMIGSATKRRTFENGLAKRGLASADLARLTCPIGIPALNGKEPSTIAIAVAAQLLQLRESAAAAASPLAARA